MHLKAINGNHTTIRSVMNYLNMVQTSIFLFFFFFNKKVQTNYYFSNNLYDTFIIVECKIYVLI